MVDRLPGRADLAGALDGVGLLVGLGGPDRRRVARRRGAAARVSARVSMPSSRRDAGLAQQLLERHALRRPVASTRRVTTRARAWTRSDSSSDRDDPVAAGHRVGQDHDLARVGGIGQDLAPAGRGGREDQVALGREPARRGGARGGACRPRAPAGPGTKRRLPLGGGGRRGVRGAGCCASSLLSGITVPDLKDGRSLADASPSRVGLVIGAR